MGIGILIGVLIIPAILGLVALVLTGIQAIPYYYLCIKTYFAGKKEKKNKTTKTKKVNNEVKKDDGQ